MPSILYPYTRRCWIEMHFQINNVILLYELNNALLICEIRCVFFVKFPFCVPSSHVRCTNLFTFAYYKSQIAKNELMSFRYSIKIIQFVWNILISTKRLNDMVELAFKWGNRISFFNPKLHRRNWIFLIRKKEWNYSTLLQPHVSSESI